MTLCLLYLSFSVSTHVQFVTEVFTHDSSFVVGVQKRSILSSFTSTSLSFIFEGPSTCLEGSVQLESGSCFVSVSS